MLPMGLETWEEKNSHPKGFLLMKICNLVVPCELVKFRHM